jgi:predicted Zn-dependent protease
MSDSRRTARSDRLIRLDDSRRVLSREECETIMGRIRGFARGGGEIAAQVRNWWTGELRWGRNRVSLASDRRDLIVMITRYRDGYGQFAITNQLDDASLEATVRAAERAVNLFSIRNERDFTMPSPNFEYPNTRIRSDATYGLSTEARGAVARAAIEPAESKGLLSAGYLEMRAQSAAFLDSNGRLLYTAPTQAQCSMTVRDQKGTGSGWAGLSGFDWAAIDPQPLSERAVEKALASRNPVALEPGRYTVILEPQAVHDLVGPLLRMFDRDMERTGGGPFILGRDEALGIWRTKLGLKVADERVTIEQNPLDPALGVVPFDIEHDNDVPPFLPAKWIDQGVLTSMFDHRSYALQSRNENIPFRQSYSFRMSGGETSLEEMIASTKRGLLVSRFSNVSPLDIGSVLLTGVTRDGLWLIENGKVTKAVKNFRFTESPLFMLNSLEQLGPAVPVFRPVKDPYALGVTPAILPSLKARDFSFTSTIDAV